MAPASQDNQIEFAAALGELAGAVNLPTIKMTLAIASSTTVHGLAVFQRTSEAEGRNPPPFPNDSF